ncbi:DUF4167 domain-containing protein [Parasedimentitalea marina]|uniref:DUF4167 domain-containing protein n=1 Tax=Parasedimentitalea marina TaxID=2483033 RepID=A0A3T0N247_9RHOB|nr:DUF4167 domain-containing protein [Parasedimentitalea marina]AZV78096.1 DUF4167 domain-containing protein [Parasedimentitalea marina]
MRSSKSRSRSKSNRNRPAGGGNVVNRVFDSSGPEGKVRGTPQQIIDKYNQLARDAQLGSDRVAVENFQQHAEHYMRMLGEAQREQDARREEQERQNRDRQAERDRERVERQEREAAARNDAAARNEPVSAPRPAPSDDPAGAPQPDVLDMSSPVEASGDSGLVETPESKPKKQSTRRPRTRKPAPKPQEPVADKAAGEPAAMKAETPAAPVAPKVEKKPAKAAAPKAEAPAAPVAPKLKSQSPRLLRLRLKHQRSLPLNLVMRPKRLSKFFYETLKKAPVQ